MNGQKERKAGGIQEGRGREDREGKKGREGTRVYLYIFLSITYGCQISSSSSFILTQVTQVKRKV